MLSPGSTNIIQSPAHLSLSTNGAETLGFFKQIKDLALANESSASPQGEDYVIQFNKLERISARCSVVLTAEMDRLRRAQRHQLVVRGDLSQAPDDLKRLSQMGAFELISEKPELGSRNDVGSTDSPVAIPFISGTNHDPAFLAQLETAIRTIFRNYNYRRILAGALTEATVNSANHAYLTGSDLRYPCSDKRWWAVAMTNPERTNLRVFAMDLGHGIPKTVADSIASNEQKMERYISENHPILKDLERDDELVEYCLLNGFTRTGEPNRGRGGVDILKPGDYMTGSMVRITSGRAEVSFKARSVVGRRLLPAHVGGTMIEWFFSTDPLIAPDWSS